MNYLLFCLLAVLSSSVFCLAETPRKPTAKPNIVFVLVDDMGWSDTSVPFHFDADGKEILAPGNKIFKTPAIQRLADQGVRFTNAYAASVCSPSRTAIMSGCNPSRTHITNWTHPAKPIDTSDRRMKDIAPPAWNIHGLNNAKQTIATMFKSSGYKTLYIGKSHLGPTSEHKAQPDALGFDVNIAGCGAGQPGSYFGKDNYAEAPRRNDVNQPLGPRDVPGLKNYYGSDVFLTDALTTELLTSIEQTAKTHQPFFAFFAHYAVHTPLMSDPQFESLYSNLNDGMKKYATLVSGVDKSVNELLTKLEQLGIADNTLIVFASDNGGTAPVPQPCAPLRNKKGTPYEGGIRTPLIVAWAKKNPQNIWQQRYPIQSGSLNHHIVALQDLYATFGAIIGSKRVPRGIDSQDFSGYLSKAGKSPREQSYFLNYPHEHNDDYYVLYRRGDWKVIYRYHTKKWELYNLKTDLGEQNDLSQTNPKELALMAKALKSEHKRHNSQSPIDVKTKKAMEIILP